MLALCTCCRMSDRFVEKFYPNSARIYFLSLRLHHVLRQYLSSRQKQRVTQPIKRYRGACLLHTWPSWCLSAACASDGGVVMQGRDDAQATVVGGRLTVSKQAKLQSFGCVTVVKGITGSISCEGTAPCKRARMIHNAFQLRRGNDG